MSASSLHAPLVVYREEQNFDWRVYLSLGFVVLSGWTVVGLLPMSYAFRSLLCLLIGLFPATLVVGLLRLTTEVTPNGVILWFGWIPTYRKMIPIEGITLIEPTTFRPIRDHGGWGIRFSRQGERVFTAHGDQGVRIQLADGTKVILGSQRSGELARAIERSLRPGN